MAAAAPAGWAAASADSSTLPQIPSTLQGSSCTTPSTKSAAQTPWQQTLLAPSRAWGLSRGAGVTVAVVDTGVDTTGTPTLSGRVTAGPDTASGGTAGDDCVGHGTFVAGLIAASESPGVGFAGVAPEAQILAVRATDPSGSATADHVAAGITAAVSGGASIIDVPIALAGGSTSLSAAVQQAEQHNVLVVAPAYAQQQNSGQSAPAAYPAALPGVLAVAALQPSGNSDLPQAPATAPALAAPGQNVMSVGPGGSGDFIGTGAEFASAFVAGTAALVDSYRPGLTVGQLTDRLERTAYRAAASGPDPLVGWGTVDPDAAVSMSLPTSGSRAAEGAHTALRLPPRASRTGEYRAWAITAGAAGLMVLVALGAVIVPRGRRRGWRPGMLGPGAMSGPRPAPHLDADALPFP